MLQLYHNGMSTCAQKVRLALQEAGIEWESHHLKLRGDEQLRPAYLAINPKGQVPAIVDGDVVVVESTVINEYLVDSRGATWLLPDDAQGRARMRWWTRQIDDDVFSSIGTISQAIAFRHQYLATGPETLSRILAAIPEESRREGKRVAFSSGLANPGLPMAARRLNKLLGDMDAELEQREWLAGERLSLADIGLAPFVQRLEQLSMTMMFDGRTHLQAWFQQMKARPSYKEAMEAWFNADYLALMKQSGDEVRPLISEMIQNA